MLEVLRGVEPFPLGTRRPHLRDRDRGRGRDPGRVDDVAAQAPSIHPQGSHSPCCPPTVSHPPVVASPLAPEPEPVVEGPALGPEFRPIGTCTWTQ